MAPLFVGAVLLFVVAPWFVVAAFSVRDAFFVAAVLFVSAELFPGAAVFVPVGAAPPRRAPRCFPFFFLLFVFFLLFLEGMVIGRLRS